MSDFWCPLANNVIEGVAVLDGITQQEAFSLQERGHLITTQLELLLNLNAITRQKLNKRYMQRKVWYNNKHNNELIRHVPILKQAIRIMVLGIPIQFLLITKLQGIFVIARAVITIERVTNCIKT